MLPRPSALPSHHFSSAILTSDDAARLSTDLADEEALLRRGQLAQARRRRGQGRFPPPPSSFTSSQSSPISTSHHRSALSRVENHRTSSRSAREEALSLLEALDDETLVALGKELQAIALEEEGSTTRSVEDVRTVPEASEVFEDAFEGGGEYSSSFLSVLLTFPAPFRFVSLGTDTPSSAAFPFRHARAIERTRRTEERRASFASYTSPSAIGPSISLSSAPNPPLSYHHHHSRSLPVALPPPPSPSFPSNRSSDTAQHLSSASHRSHTRSPPPSYSVVDPLPVRMSRSLARSRAENGSGRAAGGGEGRRRRTDERPTRTVRGADVRGSG